MNAAQGPLAPLLMTESALANCGIVHAAREAIVTFDADQNIVMLNPAAEQMFACPARQALGGALSRFLPERLRDEYAAQLREFVQSGAREQAVEHPSPMIGLRANGEEFPFEASICRVDVSSEGRPRRYFTALMRDLSNEQALEHQLQALQRQMRAIFDLAPVAIWITQDDHVVFANRACASLFGASSQQALVGRSLNELLRQASPGGVQQRLAMLLSPDAKVSAVHEQIHRFDGEIRDVEIAVAALPDHGTTTLQMVITDLTQKLRESRAVERSRRELQRLSASHVAAREEERRRIARELHDELGQRLTALKLDIATLDPRAGRDIGQHVASMLEMVDDTIASVRRLATELRPLMLDDLGLNAAIESLAGEAVRRLNLKVSLDLAAIDFPVGDATAIAIYRMVQEALTNVARHARATRVEIRTFIEAAKLVLVVQDNGIGFSDDAPLSKSSLGLIGISDRALMLGGQMRIDNLHTGGARLRVELPLGTCRSDEPNAAATQPMPSRADDDGSPQPTDATRLLSSQPQPQPGSAAGPSRAEALAHELHVHQIELESQNEELRRTQLELTSVRDRYLHLYDFAPVGYVTLDRHGSIVEMNLRGASMLGQPRALLVTRRFARYVAPADGDRWHRHFAHAMQRQDVQRVEIALKPATGALLPVQVDCLRVVLANGEPTLRITLTDISAREQAEMDRRVARSAVAAREGDRRKVARELHEELGQQLSALKMSLASLRGPQPEAPADVAEATPAGTHPEGPAHAPADRQLGDMLSLLDSSLAAVRRITGDMRPLLLDDLGLNAAIEWLVRDRSKRSGVEMKLALQEDDPPLDESDSVALFRLMEEALARATLAPAAGQRVFIDFHRRGSVQCLTIHCEGALWPEPVSAGGAQLPAALREQAHLLDGHLELDVSAPNGWTLAARIPLDHARLPPEPSTSNAAYRWT